MTSAQIPDKGKHKLNDTHPNEFDYALPVTVTPNKKETQKIKTRVRIQACAIWSEAFFDFGRTFIKSSPTKKLSDVLELFRIDCEEKYPDSRITIFGHADPVDSVDFNHALSEKRAFALYALLTRDVSAWCTIFKSEVIYLQQQLKFAGEDPGPIDGVIGPLTKKAIKSYMDHAAINFQLSPNRFLGNGKFAYQGCSEFNPVKVFSISLDSHLRQKKYWHARNIENFPNRRVVAFLLPPEFEGKDSSWTCRKGNAGLAICRKMTNNSWSKSIAKLTNDTRIHKDGDRTFTCPVYTDLADTTLCENMMPELVPIPIEKQEWTVEIAGYEHFFDSQLQKFVKEGFFSKGHYQYVQDTVDVHFEFYLQFIVVRKAPNEPWNYKEGRIIEAQIEIVNNIRPENDPGRNFRAEDILSIKLTDPDCINRLKGIYINGEIVPEDDVYKLYNLSGNYPAAPFPKTQDFQFRRDITVGTTVYTLVKGQSSQNFDKIPHFRLMIPSFSIPMEIKFKDGNTLTITERIEKNRWSDDFYSQWIPLKESSRQFEHVRMELLDTPIYDEPYMIVHYTHKVTGRELKAKIL